MNITKLKLEANQIRKDVMFMLYEAKSGHTAGSLDLADIFTVLYCEILKHNPKRPKSKNRDFVILSNGHVCPVLYATLAEQGYFEKEELKTLRNVNSRLQGHPHYSSLPGVENSGGPLGQGISQAIGLAVSLIREKKKNTIYCFAGDGELEEGQCWEAIMYAGKEKLDNLILIVDRNHIQIDGDTESIGGLGDINKKFLAFDWKVIEFDGNDIVQIQHTFKYAKEMKEKPVCLIANTLAGKGISFMEGNYHWHGKVPNKEEYEKAMTELESIDEKIKNE